MKTISVTAALAFTLGATLVSPAFAGDFYNMNCASQQGSDVWTLALSVTGDHAAQLFRETGRIRTGTYNQTGDDVYATVGEMRIHLGVAWGQASWQAGAAKGTFSCRYIGDQQLARWQAPAYALAPPAAPVPLAQYDPSLAPEPAPPAPAPSQPAPGKMCDMQNNCWSAAPSTTGSVGSVPLEVTDNQAFVTMRIGRLSFRALLDSGATSLSLPETGADALIASGAATEGPSTSVIHADGLPHPCRTIIIRQMRIGSHVVSDVRSTVEPDSSISLVGMAVLRAISGRFSIDLANSELRFE